MAIQLIVKVKPNSRNPGLEEQEDGTWVARVNAPPVDGKANEVLVKMVAKHFGVAKSSVQIQAGAGARQKRLIVDV